MDEQPLWLRAAAVVAALAGIEREHAAAGFGADDARAIDASLDAVRAPSSRAAVARAIARERITVTAPLAPAGPVPEHALVGARVVASLLRALPPAERATVARSLDPALLRAAAAVASSAPPCDAPSLSRAIACATRRLGRAPDAGELGALALSALGRGEARAPAFVHGTLRWMRALGLPVRRAFEPFVVEPAGRVG